MTKKPDQTPEELIAKLKEAGRWPANYDDASDDDGDADDGVTMTEIFEAIQKNCDDNGIVMSNGYGVLDALAEKLLDAPVAQPLAESSRTYVDIVSPKEFYNW